MRLLSPRALIFVALFVCVTALFLSQFVISGYPGYGRLRLLRVMTSGVIASDVKFDNWTGSGDHDDTLEACPLPYRGTDCAINIFASMEKDVSRHSGSLTINGSQVSDWKNSTGILLFRIGYKCELNELVKFDVASAQMFASYIAALSRGTLLIGLSGDSNMLKNSVSEKLLKSLGVSSGKIEQNCVYGFTLKIGFSGLTQLWKKRRSDGNFNVSKTVTQGSPVSVNVNSPSEEELGETYPEVKQGGHWRPKDCTPHTTIAIVIPFRDRQSHLRVLLNNLLPFLMRQNVEVSFYVIEQAGKTIFNRAKMMNIGYHEAKQRANYTCYIFHDVDILPEDLCNIYTCSDQPRHFTVRYSTGGYRGPTTRQFGGVTGFTSAQFEKVNGFSNVFFAWGGEDDEISYRVYAKKMSITRYPGEVATYKMISHSRDETNPRSRRTMAQMAKHAKAYMSVDGLNSLQYKRVSVKMKPLYTHITVEIEGPSILSEIPTFYNRTVTSFNQLMKQETQKQKRSR